MQASFPRGHSIGLPPADPSARTASHPYQKRQQARGGREVIDLEYDDSFSLALSSRSFLSSIDLHNYSESVCCDTDNFTPHASFSSGGGLHFMQLWMAHADALGPSLFRAQAGPGHTAKVLSEAAASALQPKKSTDIVGNKQGSYLLRCTCN